MLGYYEFLWDDSELNAILEFTRDIFALHQPDCQIQMPVLWGACYYTWSTLTSLWVQEENGYALDGEVLFDHGTGLSILLYQEYCLEKFERACLNPYHPKYLC